MFDSNAVNKFVSAVGPTLQSASTTPITAQIFYARNIQGTSPSNDFVTVSFTGGTGSISAGAVAVEYSGLDEINPLDSVSANSSISTGLYLGSDFAALSSTSVVVFGGGLTDGNYTPIPITSSGFTPILSSSVGPPYAMTEEDNFFPVSPPPPPPVLPLQQATAGPPTGTGWTG